MSLAPSPPPLTTGTKFAYGFGSIAVGVATLGLSSSLLQPYLNRVIGLPALWVGTAIMLTLILDAFIDPAIGRFSDNLRTRWGRRHPLMYLSIPLIAGSVIAFWNSPGDWPVAALGVYLIGMLVVLRLCVSLYEVPSAALAPELTDDYHARTSLFSYRYFFGVLGGLGMNIVLYQVFLSTAHGGILNRAGYAQYGVVAAAVMGLSILVTALGTHRHIAGLSRPPVRKITVGESIREIGATLGNRSLVVVMTSGLLGGVSTGMSGALSQYFYIELWGLRSEQLAYLAIAAVAGSVVAAGVTGPISKRLGKKRGMLVTFAISATTASIPLALKLLGLMPPNSSPWIFNILAIDVFISTLLGIVGYILISSMVADVVEDAAIRTGVRSEGLVFAANGLLPKFTAGIGVFLAGLLLAAVAFPTHAPSGTVDPAVMRHLAILYLPFTFCMTALAIGVLVFYRIDQKTHEHNVSTLQDAAAAAEIGRVEEARPGLIGPGPA